MHYTVAIQTTDLINVVCKIEIPEYYKMPQIIRVVCGIKINVTGSRWNHD
jgi:hypothetical protein